MEQGRARHLGFRNRRYGTAACTWRLESGDAISSARSLCIIGVKERLRFETGRAVVSL